MVHYDYINLETPALKKKKSWVDYDNAIRNVYIKEDDDDNDDKEPLKSSEDSRKPMQPY